MNDGSYIPGKCLNCDEVVVSRRRLFCGERCRQIAELIRYARRKLAAGTYDRPDIAEAITIRKGLLVEGFYERERCSPKIREELLMRSNGRCEKCGGDFAPEGDARFTVQHTATDNGVVREAWCYRCNMNDVLSKMRPVVSGEAIDFHMKFDFRVHAPQPVLLCDDPDNWPTICRDLQSAARRWSGFP